MCSVIKGFHFTVFPLALVDGMVIKHEENKNISDAGVICRDILLINYLSQPEMVCWSCLSCFKLVLVVSSLPARNQLGDLRLV